MNGEIDFAEALRQRVGMLKGLSVDALVLAARGPLLELDAAVVAHWFADPVNPMVMGAR